LEAQISILLEQPHKAVLRIVHIEYDFRGQIVISKPTGMCFLDILPVDEVWSLPIKLH